jgi:hypothetical protein
MLHMLFVVILLTGCAWSHKDVVDTQEHSTIHVVKQPERLLLNRTITNYRAGPIKSVVVEKHETNKGTVTEDTGLDLRRHKLQEGEVKSDFPVLKIAIGLALILAVGIFLILRKVAP